MLRFLAVGCLCLGLQGEVVDRLAIAIGLRAITQLQLDEELRVTAFLNEKPVVRNTTNLREAADRMVEQYLIKREMDLSRYPLPTDDEINKLVEQIRAHLGGTQFAGLLKRYALTESCLKDHLALQLTTLEFIEYRFRPDIGISDSDIQNAYTREVQEWKGNHPGLPPPSLESSKESIQRKLGTERTDKVLNAWLEESRRQVDIIYFDQSLQ